MIEPKGRVAIADFGLARGVRVEDGEASAHYAGTPVYMAPEQLLGQASGPEVDLYALGLLLYELLTGERPFAFAGSALEPAQRVTGPPPDVAAQPAVPSGLKPLLAALLAREPLLRPAGAGAVVDALDRWEPHSAGPSAPRPHAPIPSRGPLVAVLPLEGRGGDDVATLGEDLAAALAEVLGRTRGIRVVASGAARDRAAGLDPHEAAAALGADAVVTGAVRRTPDGVRVTTRLIERDGLVRLVDRRTLRLGDLARAQGELAHAVARALAGEIDAVRWPGQPDDAMADYLAARRKLRRNDVVGEEGAVRLLERVVARAPSFAPARAALAQACVAAWFYTDGEPDRPWQGVAGRAVHDALVRAPDLAEARLAAGTYEAQCGDYPAAIEHLVAAITLQPASAPAQEYLGRLQVECGQTDEGRARLRAAADLDPLLVGGLVDLARDQLLHGEGDAAQASLAEATRRAGGSSINVSQLALRAAAWRGDAHAVAAEERALRLSGRPVPTLTDVYAPLVRGRIGLAEAEARLAPLLAHYTNLRFLTLAHQLAAESCALAGEPDAALRHVEAAAELALFDLAWLARCPALDPLRDAARFRALVAVTEARVAAAWEAPRVP
ncbi:MAG: protein kinase domain-containing protein [Myxococcota bacterium]